MSIVHDRPSLEQLKKQAKELLSAHQSGKSESCKVLKRLKKFSAASDKEILETKIPLHDVQYAVAMEYGFESWAKLKKFVEQRNLTFGASPDEIFEILRSIPSGENILSVDIGSRTLKIAEFANPVNGNYTLYSFAVEEYDLSVPGESMFKTISETLRRKRNEIGFKGSKCLLSLPSKSVFIRYMTLSAKDAEENNLRSRIADGLKSLNLDEPVISWHKSSASEMGEFAVLVAAVGKNYLEQMVKAVRKAGLEPVLILPSSAAALNSALANGVGEKSCELVLNIGASSTTVIFCNGADYRIRTLPLGWDEVTRRIADKFGISVADAEKLKREKGYMGKPEITGTSATELNSDPVANEISRIASGFMDEICVELKRSVGFFTTQFGGILPSRILLAGGGSVMSGIPSLLKEKMNMPVEYLNPFRKITIDKSVSRDELANVAHLFSEMIGLDLCVVGDISNALKLKLD